MFSPHRRSVCICSRTPDLRQRALRPKGWVVRPKSGLLLLLGELSRANFLRGARVFRSFAFSADHDPPRPHNSFVSRLYSVGTVCKAKSRRRKAARRCLFSLSNLTNSFCHPSRSMQPPPPPSPPSSIPLHNTPGFVCVDKLVDAVRS